MTFGGVAHGGEVPFSSHHIRDTYHQRDLSLLTFSVVTWWRQHLSDLFTPPPPHSCYSHGEEVTTYSHTLDTVNSSSATSSPSSGNMEVGFRGVSLRGFPGDSDGKESACNAGFTGFDPWVRQIPWRRE